MALHDWQIYLVGEIPQFIREPFYSGVFIEINDWSWVKAKRSGPREMNQMGSASQPLSLSGTGAIFV